MNFLKIKLVIINFFGVVIFLFASNVHAPKPFKTIMTENIGREWTPSLINTIENRAHVVLMDNSETYYLKVNSSIQGNLGVGDVSELKNGNATYGDALRSMFQLLDLNTASLASDDLAGVYTIHPLLASYYALDSEMEGGQIKVRDKSSFYSTEQDTISFLVFDLGSPSNEGTIITAVSKYVYNDQSESYEPDDNWIPYLYIKINSDQTLSLTGQVSEATEWKIMDANGLVNTSIDAGSDFNPQATSWQTNTFAAYPTNNNGELSAWHYDDSPLKTDQFYNNVDDDYQNQLGYSDEANIAAHAVLNIIEQNLIDLGLSLRYSTDTYLTFRSALLNNNFASIDMYNSILGERTVEHVYFTSAYSDNGDYHPFMVIATHNAPSGPQFLINVARPPGDGTPGTSYEEQTITRNAILEQKLIKIPLRDYGLITNLTDNDLTEFGSLASDQNVSALNYDVDNYTSTSSTGIAVDGVIMYPSSNNVLVYATFAAEITSTGIHVGRGMGFHYHADGHAFNHNGINLYNESDYVDRNHPPIIGFVFDGIALFGRYDENYGNMDGISESLDEFGGHSHGDYGYHHHAFSSSATQSQGPNTFTYTQNFLQRGAFRGAINDIPGFLEVSTNQFMNNEIKRYVGASGTSQLSTKSTSSLKLPDSFRLHSNYPNPFNPTTHIKFDLPTSSMVNITIYNVIGHHIRTLLNSNQPAGHHSLHWDSRNGVGKKVAAGIYIYSIRTGEFSATKKMVLLE